MKKTLIISLIAGCVLLGAVAGYMVYRKSQQPKQPTPEQFKVRLPTGEVVTAYKIVQATQRAPMPSGTRIIIKGRIVREKDDIGSSQLVLVSDTGVRFILLNAPYMRKLEKEGIKKTAKLKGITIEKTSFKNYPALYIEDIVEIEE